MCSATRLPPGESQGSNIALLLSWPVQLCRNTRNTKRSVESIFDFQKSITMFEDNVFEMCNEVRRDRARKEWRNYCTCRAWFLVRRNGRNMGLFLVSLKGKLLQTWAEPHALGTGGNTPLPEERLWYCYKLCDVTRCVCSRMMKRRSVVLLTYYNKACPKFLCLNDTDV